MPVSSAVRARAHGFLAPDDAVRFLFPAQVVLGGSVLIVVSDQAVTVLSTGFWRRSTPKAVHARYPRHIHLGPVEARPIPEFTLHGFRYEVDEEYVPVINAADAELSTDALPPDPLPDL